MAVDGKMLSLSRAFSISNLELPSGNHMSKQKSSLLRISLILCVMSIPALVGWQAYAFNLRMQSLLASVAEARSIKFSDTAKSAAMLEKALGELSSQNNLFVMTYFTAFPQDASLQYDLVRETRYTKEAAGFQAEEELLKLDEEAFRSLFKKRLDTMKTILSFEPHLDQLLKKKLYWTLLQKPKYYLTRRAAQYKAQESARYDEQEKFNAYVRTLPGYRNMGGYGGYSRGYSSTSRYSRSYASHAGDSDDPGYYGKGKNDAHSQAWYDEKGYNLENPIEAMNCLENHDCSAGTVDGDIAIIKDPDVR